MRVMKTDNAVDVWPDAALKNFIFYIFSMYEFSHSLGHLRHCNRAPKSSNGRCSSNNGQDGAMQQNAAMSQSTKSLSL
jgi:hypothetical protein